MALLEDILAFLANPLMLFLISLPLLIFIGIYIGVRLSQPRKNRVIKIDPESGRGVEYDVESEDTINAYCKPVGNSPPQRFIKRHKALNIIRKGPFKLQSYALWLARSGSAYTTELKSEKVQLPLRDAVRNIFGKDLYERIPNDEKTGFIKERIEKSEVAVTVELPASELTPQGMTSVSSDDVRRGDIDSFIGALVRGVKSQFKSTGGDALKIIFILGTGVAVGIVLSLIFHWGAPTVVEGATQIILGACL